ncbi:MAG: hypothetical protein WA705_25150 [Candidatus Ozemobacteraceae bacterium]
MKTFTYSWTPEYYLLHLQFDGNGSVAFEAMVTHIYEGGTIRKEPVPVLKGVESHRIMVSRTHPKEATFTVEYPDHIKLGVYQLDDRAYYPTESFFVG